MILFQILIKPNGYIGRWTYLLAGLSLFAAKLGIDTLVSRLVFKKEWLLKDYLIHSDIRFVYNPAPEDMTRYLVMLAVAVPFMLFGLNLTQKRLRSAGFPIWPTLFFFVPFLNMLMFLLLAVVDSIPGIEHNKKPATDESPEEVSALKGFLVALILGFTAFLFCYFSVSILKNYGVPLFAGIPFFIGFASSIVASKNDSRQRIYITAFIAITSLFFCLFFLSFEGIICIIMAAPLAVIICVAGIEVGLAAKALSNTPRGPKKNLSLLLVLLPLWMTTDHLQNQPPELQAVETEIVIDASKEKVWATLVRFPPMGEPDEWLFQTGVAYPIQAYMEGEGVGAVRHCRFTTGEFVEPITTWQPSKLMQFTVKEQPAPMKELTIYDHIHAAHLHGYFVSKKGEFRLKELGPNQTLLIGTTWYTHDIAPAFYWSLWSDYIIHKIHYRVLKHIKITAEVKD